MTTEAEQNNKPSGDGAPADDQENKGDGEVYMDRHMGFLRATGVVVNSVIGTGIFLSPTGIARTVGSVGATLMVWVGCGIITLLMGLVFIELGTMMPKAGGMYAFALESFGPMVAFSIVWGNQIIANPAMIVVMGRVAAQYFFRLFFPTCVVPYVIQQLLIPVVAFTLTFIHCKSIYVGTKLQTVFSVAKVGSLVLISIIGIVMMAQGHTKNFDPRTSFQNTRADPGAIAVAVLFGFFSYQGWENLFIAQEEVKNPNRTLPLVCISSLLVITAVYVFTNVAYFSVMTVQELVASPGVAITFAERSMGDAAWIMSIFVAVSTIGWVNTYLVSGSRVVFSMSRQGSLPRVLSMLNADTKSPMPAIFFLLVVGSFYLPIRNIYDIISYNSFINMFAYILTVASWFYFRFKRRDAERAFRVPLVIPALVLVLLVALIILAFVRSPLVYGIGLGVYLSSYPVYLLNRYFLSRSRHVKRPMDAVTIFVQRWLRVVPEKRSQDIVEKEN